MSALAFATHALADQTISSGVTTPVKTSTANNGQPDNVVINSGGSVTVTSGAAVTVDSNNTVANSGAITIQNANDVTGILATSGRTSTISNNGSITVNETASQSDTNGDGILNGPFATGADRFGIRVLGPGTFTGDINNASGGVITVQGNNSAGISVEGPLQGNLTNAGSISVQGDNSYGLHAVGPVSGAVTLTGGVSAVGQGAQAVVIGGDIGGRLQIGSTVAATGYRTTSRPTADILAKMTPDEMLQGGSAVVVNGSIGGGLLVSAPPATASTTNTDVNGDGVTDASETSGAVNSYGSAPAIVVGAVGRNITLGNVGAGDSAYGVTILGAVGGAGVYDKVSATGLQLGVAGGGTVNTSGGVQVMGSVGASSYQADATAMRLNAGVIAPAIHNTGSIAASATADTAVHVHAIDIQQGASASILQNAGTISATIVGSNGETTAISDGSGTLSRIENTGLIQAVIQPSTGAVVAGSSTAIDASANANGVYMLQYQPSGITTLPATIGAVKLGSGNDTLDIQAGSLVGDISFGAGANQLNVNNGAFVGGALTAQGGTVGLNVANGTLQINNAAPLSVTNLNLGGSSKLILTADPTSGRATELDATTATIASGAQFGMRLTSIQNGSQTYTVVRAGQLTVGTLPSSLAGDTPYIYDASVSANQAAGTVSVTMARKTAAELQLPESTAAGYEPVVAAVSRDAGLSNALLAQTNRAGFLNMYNQLLPNHSGGVFELAAAGAEAFARPLDDRQAADGGGLWAQEVNYGLVQDRGGDVPGYRAWGLGLIIGYELPAARLGVFGVTLGASSGQVKGSDDPSSTKFVVSTFEGGAYWRGAIGHLTGNARVAGEYLSVNSDRVVQIGSGTSTLYSGTANGRWSGAALTARLRVAYEAKLGKMYVRPQAGLDYYRLAENGYTETGGGAVDLKVGSRDSSRMSAMAGVAVGAMFGGDWVWGPELLLGYRAVVTQNLGTTTANFVSGGDSFVLLADNISGEGPIVRLALKGDNGSGGFAIEGGAERRSGLTILDARLAAHLRF